MAGQKKRQKIVDELLFRHRLAGFRVDRAEQPGEEIVSIAGRSMTCVNHIGNNGPKTDLPKAHAAATRARQPDRQVEHRIGGRPGDPLHIVGSPPFHRFAKEGAAAWQQCVGDGMVRRAQHVGIRATEHRVDSHDANRTRTAWPRGHDLRVSRLVSEREQP